MTPSFYTSVNRYGNNLLYRGYNQNGLRVQKKVKFSPTLYVPSRNEESEWKTLDGFSVEPIDFDTMREAKDFLQKYKDVDNFTVYGNSNYIQQYIAKRFNRDIEFDFSKINITSFDIEVESGDGFPVPELAEQAVNLITLKASNAKHWYVWGLDDWDITKSYMNGQPVVYRQFKTESDLLLDFLGYWSAEETCPDIITGWYIRYFDIPYLVNRITKIMGIDQARRLSPWGMLNERTKNLQGEEMQYYELVGIQEMDYREVFLKFGVTSYGPQESYKLDHIAYVILGEKKLSYEEYGSLHTLSRENHQKFVDYGIKDTQLIERLEEETGLIELAVTLAYSCGVNFGDTFGTTAICDSAIHRLCNTKKIAIPPSRHNVKMPYPGGYVKDSLVGMYDWVVSVDLASMYPNLFVQYNISTETIMADKHGPAGVDYHMNNREPWTDNILAVNGVVFRKDRKGIIPEIIDDFYARRKIIKGEMLEKQKLFQSDKSQKHLEREIAQLNNRQMAVKIFMNSMYGACGSPYFRYYDLRMAEGITLCGQLTIRWAERGINEAMNQVMGTEGVDYVIAMDTDSCYINFGPLVEKFKPKNTIKFLDEIMEQHFKKKIASDYQVLANKMNTDNKMVMDREAICDKGVFVAAKNYIINVLNNEGVQYDEPKLKVTGIKAVKPSTPEVVRDKFRETFKIIMLGDEKAAQDYIAQFKSEFKTLTPEEIAFPRGVSNVTKYVNHNTIYTKGTPIGSRAAILYNYHTKAQGLSKHMKPINNGDKIKFTYLRKPNPIKENVIAFPDYLPEKLNLHKYVDYDLQFEKSFLNPIEPIFRAVGWTVEDQQTLEDFFA